MADHPCFGGCLLAPGVRSIREENSSFSRDAQRQLSIYKCFGALRRGEVGREDALERN